MDEALRKLRESRVFGVVLVATSALLFSIMSLVVQLTGPRIPSFEQVFSRCLIQGSLAGALLWRSGQSPFAFPPAKLRWMVARGFFGFSSMSCLFFALTRLTLADANVIFFSSAISTAIAGRLVLGERFGLFESVAALCTIVGVVLVSQPTWVFGEQTKDAHDSSGRAAGILVSVLGALLSSGAYIAIRKVGKDIDANVLVFYFALVGVTLSPVGVLVQGAVMPSGLREWSCLLAVGLLGFVAQSAFNRGVQLEDAGRANLIRMVDILFAFAWQVFLMRQPVGLWSGLGALVIAISVFAVGLKKYRSAGVSAAPVAADEGSRALLDASTEENDELLPLDGCADRNELP
eukprot:Amastigsp_a847227_13.p1 type:complete len:348 gc:universal Amastigsp_a847227_13:111-1154(+)